MLEKLYQACGAQLPLRTSDIEMHELVPVVLRVLKALGPHEAEILAMIPIEDIELLERHPRPRG